MNANAKYEMRTRFMRAADRWNICKLHVIISICNLRIAVFYNLALILTHFPDYQTPQLPKSEKAKMLQLCSEEIALAALAVDASYFLYLSL